MAGVCSKGYQSVLKKVKDFLKGINELTDENKGRLNKLDEVSELVASIKKEKGGVEGTPGVQTCIAIIENVLIALLTGLYTVLLSAFSDISSMIKEMVNKQKEDERFVLPQPMQARVDAVERYLKNANGRLEKIDDTLSNLIKQVRVYYLLHVTNNLRFHLAHVSLLFFSREYMTYAEIIESQFQ